MQVKRCRIYEQRTQISSFFTLQVRWHVSNTSLNSSGSWMYLRARLFGKPTLKQNVVCRWHSCDVEERRAGQRETDTLQRRSALGRPDASRVCRSCSVLSPNGKLPTDIGNDWPCRKFRVHDLFSDAEAVVSVCPVRASHQLELKALSWNRVWMVPREVFIICRLNCSTYIYLHGNIF